MIKRIGDRNLVKALISTYSPKLFTLKFSIALHCFCSRCCNGNGSAKPGGSEGMNRKGIDVVIALDVSKSMLATDLAPNRLERAKQLLVN